jgi:hypothetical protein
MADGRAYRFSVMQDDEAVHVVRHNLHPGPMIAHIGGMIGGGVESPGDYHISRSDLGFGVLHLQEARSQGIQLQEYPVQVS